jgi:hypothetical protein
MSLAEDQHPVGDLRPDSEHEPFRISVRARVPGWDLHRLDSSVGQDRVKRLGELTGPITDQEPEVRSAITQIHQEVADLLDCPQAIGIGGYSEDVHVTATDLQDEQAIQALEGHRAVHVEEVGGEHRRCLSVQELQPGRVGAPFWCREIFRALRTRRIVDAPTRWPSLSSSPWILLYPQPRFSVASCLISVAISALTGGRPIRFG